MIEFDPHHAGHERLYYPGETNMVMADIALINKVDTAPPGKEVFFYYPHMGSTLIFDIMVTTRYYP